MIVGGLSFLSFKRQGTIPSLCKPQRTIAVQRDIELQRQDGKWSHTTGAISSSVVLADHMKLPG